MSKKPIKIIAADDHPIVIDGIKLSLRGMDEFELIGEAYSEAALYSLLQTCTPDILILDLNIKGDNSLKYLKQIYEFSPNIKIIIFSSYNAPSLIKSALSSKVNGYLLKDSPKEEFINALHTVFGGETFISPSVQSPQTTFRHKVSDEELMDAFLKKNNLSHRELEVIQLIVKGLTSEAIAEKLYISKHTVQSHRKNILRKLSLHSKVELVKFAYENNMA